MNHRKSTELRLRMAKVKANFPFKEYTSIYQYEFGKQSEDALKRIRLVWNLQMADAEITTNFERLMEQLTK